jgi:hypothetical protein
MVQNTGANPRIMFFRVPAVPERKGFGRRIRRSSVYMPGINQKLTWQGDRSEIL